MVGVGIQRNGRQQFPRWETRSNSLAIAERQTKIQAMVQLRIVQSAKQSQSTSVWT